MALLGFAVLGSACGFRGETLTHHFVIPAGYTGPIAVAADPSFGNSPALKSPVIHRVSQSGVVCVSSDSIFLPALRLTAEYTDGEPIFSNFQGLPNPPTDDSVRIEGFGQWGTATEDGSVHWLGVGNKADIEQLQNSFFGGGIEHLMPEGVSIDQFDNENNQQFTAYCNQD